MIEIGFILGRCLVYNENIDPYLDRVGLAKKGWTDTNEVSYADGHYAILGGQGHRDDESGWFHKKPHKLEEMFNPDDYYEDWMSVAEAHRHVCYAQEQFHYYPEKDGYYETVLVELAARLIERFEAKHGNIERLFRKRTPKIFKDLLLEYS